MSVVITTAKYKHLPQLESIEALCFSMPWSRQSLTHQMISENCVFLVAENENGVILGYVGLTHVLDEGYISNVAVAPEFRRQGVADRLIYALEEKARQLSLAFLTLEVRESNTPAIALYSKHRFVPVGVRKNYYEKPREDAILMTFFL